MKTYVCLAIVCFLGHSVEAADSTLLWQIGQTDNQNRDMALAPGHYQKFQDGAFFVVGQSEPQRDWPYVHPGPVDQWAGGRSHTFSILFNLRQAPAPGECRLLLDLIDTHRSAPPRLRVEINGQRFERELPSGAGDESVFGQPDKGKETRWEIAFSNLLRPGNNDITFATLSGSWFLYDAVALRTPDGAVLGPVADGTRISNIRVPPVWVKEEDQPRQPVTLQLRHVGQEKDAVIRVGGQKAAQTRLKAGLQSLDFNIAPARKATRRLVEVVVDGQVLSSQSMTISPPRLRELWLLPHSHVDIGYTHRQDEVIDVQIRNLEKGMELARASAANPPGLRFKWNPEAIWSLDHYLNRATPAQRQSLIQAVRQGEVGIDGLYANMLTGLCRPEELAQCLSFAPRLADLTGVPVESAAICDVPGWTWGLVSVMAQAGVKYFAIGPNHGDRVGTIHFWDNKPFYWKSPSGRERVLCYVVDDYHALGNLEQNVLRRVEQLDRSAFPYDTAPLFWVGTWPGGGVDNAPPDEQTVEKVIAWNRKYAAPRVVIGLAREFFHELEDRYGRKIPEFQGDLTPYWEDGAGSTSFETALNRASADRLVQAETVFAMLPASQRPAGQILEAWKNVLLYSEHTWGAWCSISKPDDAFTLDQWKIKQAFALDADRQSRQLLKTALASCASTSAPTATIDVINTTQWPRTDLAILSREVTPGIRGVVDDHSQPVPAQRLASGELAFLAREVPPFGARRFRLVPESSPMEGTAMAEGCMLRTESLTVELDSTSGAIKSLRQVGFDREFVDAKAPVGLNDFRYMLGTDAQGAQTNGPVQITVLEAGPLVATLRIESDAPGCRKLVREVRVVNGLDRVELINHVDRLSVRLKDAVHFGFGFDVPGGTVRMETPWAVVRPNLDQLPGSCRNWFTVQRWVDVSNTDYGITWAPLDAPLLQIGAMTANLLGSVALHEWMTNALSSQTLYSWAQNNHWHTNYKIDQPGVTTFRYILKPHRGGYSALESSQFGMETTRPLLALPVQSSQPVPGRLLELDEQTVLLETVKLSEDGKAVILRLFGVSGRKEKVKLAWGALQPSAVWMTDLTEKPLRKALQRIEVPGYEMVMVRADLPK